MKPLRDKIKVNSMINKCQEQMPQFKIKQVAGTFLEKIKNVWNIKNVSIFRIILYILSLYLYLSHRDIFFLGCYTKLQKIHISSVCLVLYLFTENSFTYLISKSDGISERCLKPFFKMYLWTKFTIM